MHTPAGWTTPGRSLLLKGPVLSAPASKQPYNPSSGRPVKLTPPPACHLLLLAPTTAPAGELRPPLSPAADASRHPSPARVSLTEKRVPAGGSCLPASPWRRRPAAAPQPHAPAGVPSKELPFFPHGSPPHPPTAAVGLRASPSRSPAGRGRRSASTHHDRSPDHVGEDGELHPAVDEPHFAAPDQHDTGGIVLEKKAVKSPARHHGAGGGFLERRARGNPRTPGSGCRSPAEPQRPEEPGERSRSPGACTGSGSWLPAPTHAGRRSEEPQPLPRLSSAGKRGSPPPWPLWGCPG